MKRFLLAGAAALLLAVSAGNGWERPGTPPVPFTLKDLAGRTLRSSDLAGKVVVIDFWATWCPPCLRELPELAEWWKRIKDRNDVVFLSFDVTDEPEPLKAFLVTRRIPYPVYLADELQGPYGVNDFPTKLIIDMRKGKGVVRFRRSGLTAVSDIEARVAEVLASR